MLGPALNMQWARLRSDHDVPLRRGAWYRVLSVSQLEVVVDVNQKAVLVARPYVDVSSVPPSRWTIVDRSTTSLNPRAVDARYAVCPSCRERVPVAGHPPSMRCRRCQGEFPIE